jgi:hypothetical protein
VTHGTSNFGSTSPWVTSLCHITLTDHLSCPSISRPRYVHITLGSMASATSYLRRSGVSWCKLLLSPGVGQRRADHNLDLTVRGYPRNPRDLWLVTSAQGSLGSHCWATLRGTSVIPKYSGKIRGTCLRSPTSPYHVTRSPHLEMSSLDMWAPTCSRRDTRIPTIERSRGVPKDP